MYIPLPPALADLVAVEFAAAPRVALGLENLTARLAQFVEQAKLREHARALGGQDQAGADVRDDLGPSLEDDEVDVGLGKGVCGDQAHGACAHHDDFEVPHDCVCCVFRVGRLVVYVAQVIVSLDLSS